jgi:hypothetical protein
VRGIELEHEQAKSLLASGRSAATHPTKETDIETQRASLADDIIEVECLKDDL